MRWLAVVLLAACGGTPATPAPSDPAPSLVPAEPDPVSATAQAAMVTVEGAWVRAVPPAASNTALFATLKNTGSAQVRLVGGQSALAGSVEIHTHTEVDGAMQMRRVESLDIPGQGHLHLQPGGDHVMLIGLKAPLPEGEKAKVKLRFVDGSELVVEAPVQAVAVAPHSHDAGHGHHHGG